MNTERTHLFPEDRLPTQLIAREPDIKPESALCADEGMSNAVSAQEIMEVQRLMAMAMQNELQRK